jgi:DNA-binding PadR family transcriptional regulator
MEGCTLIELATLISVVRLEDNAYGSAIRIDIEEFRGEPVPMASVYAALNRLERRRWLSVTTSRPLAVQGGRSKRLYRLTEAGRDSLQREKKMFTRLLQVLPRRF